MKSIDRKLIAVLIAALVVRIAFLLVLRDVLAFDAPGTIHGSEAYDRYAVNLLDTGVYGLEPGVADAAIPPLYGYSLALVYGLFGRGYWQVGLYHTLLDLVSITLIYFTARHLFQPRPRGEWVGALAGLCYAAYPYLVFQNLTLIDTPLFMALMHAFVLAVVLLRERTEFDVPVLLLGALAGLLLGLATLVRPILPPLALLVALWFLFRHSLLESLRRLLPVALVSALLLMPWIARNYRVFNAFVPMTTTSGANFWQGNSPYTVPVFQAGYDVQWTAPESVPSTPYDREADRQRFELAWQYLQDNPGRVPELVWTKFLVHWSVPIAPRYNPQPGEQFRIDDDGRLQIVQSDQSITGVTAANTSYDSGLMNTLGRPVHTLYFGSLLLLALLGVAITLREWRMVSLLWFVQISMTFIYVVFHPSTRYRAPSDPLLFLLSAAALV